ncbi:hypothetical protein D9615_008166 [Tricholomella constricta]|uniref:YDG domain-containing protein n=1 Tax=Tricholomella constricta TaxID=117010 RepID=A0A8H5LZN3_9AGAR|nr:hypothetical protein D9615_008166 [Tricholomella constricta]
MAAERLRRQLMQNVDLYPTGLPSPINPRFGDMGCVVGTTFKSREELANLRLHSQLFAGISGNVNEGAFSVVVSGGYIDDVDEGDVIVYTGTGGQANSFSGGGQQTADQTFAHPDNRTLQKSAETKRLVRVFRGPRSNSRYAPESG